MGAPLFRLGFLLSLVSVVGGFEMAASAATLSVVSGKTTYNVGETITLSVSGDAQGASAFGIYGRLQFTGVGSVTPNTETQKQVGTTTSPHNWINGFLSDSAHGEPGTGVFSDSFNQIAGTNPNAPDTAGGLPANNPFATETLIASSVGVVNASWNTDASSGFQFNFFGLTNAPGTSFTIVPEPTTGLLVFAGLLGLAGWRRARA